MNLWALLFLLLLLPSCAVQWVQPGKTPADTKADFQECLVEAKMRYPFSDYLLIDVAEVRTTTCMSERGYESRWAD